MKKLICLEATHQSAPLSIVSEQAAPRAAKSADKMEGAMIAGGLMTIDSSGDLKGNGCYGLDLGFSPTHARFLTNDKCMLWVCCCCYSRLQSRTNYAFLHSACAAAKNGWELLNFAGHSAQ